MPKCKFKKDGWECPLQSLPGEDYCYWHKVEDGKNPDNAKLKELKKHNIKFVYLRKAKLINKNLKNANLEEANLEEANLERANLEEANLRGANLYGANLQGANLSKVNLQEADLIEVNLQGANLNRANLEKADLIKANLEKAYLIEANLQETDLIEVNFQKANLSRTNFEKSYLERVNLQEANLSRANLRGSEFNKVNLERANLIRANLQETDLIEVSLQRANLNGANLEKANLEEINLERTNLEEANLIKVNLQRAELRGANLQRSYLEEANLHGVNLYGANLQGVNLSRANLEKTNLERVNLHGTNLIEAKLQGTYLKGANLKGANLIGVIVDSETLLDGANLTHANLYLSYLDGTKTLRNAIFEDKEINEIVADLLKSGKDLVLDVEKIKKDDPKVASKLFEKGLVRYVLTGDKIVFFNIEKKVVMVPIPSRKSKTKRLFRKEDSWEEYEIRELNDLIEKNGVERYLYKRSRKELYEASYEVYNKLYYFYIQNGKLDDALSIHYRKEEVRRKLLNERGGIHRLRSWIFDFLILKLLTGYGVKISRPIIASALIILIFTFLFWLTDGIVKEVNGTTVTPDIWDYFYHSVITFTSLGYSNIQPNLAVGHIPQLLVAIESFLGVLMMALIIFVITYRVSR